MKNYGLYIHIPFCSKKCDYCDFASFCMGEGDQKAYLNALLKEIDLVKDSFKSKTFDTIFIGGGTPSVVFDGFILTLSKKLFSSFKIAKNYEFTIEVNPNSFNEQKLNEYLLAGINRISVGVQNISDKIINGVGRLQTRANVDNTFKLLNGKIKNVSADIILGLPNENLSSVKNTIQYLLNQNVTHISAYTLQLEEGTPLENKVKKGLTTIPNDEAIVKQYNAVNKLLSAAGFIRYEISNYAKPGFECQHNLKYWNNVEYLGLGLAAHSYLNGTRFWNTAVFGEYIASISKSELPKNKEILTNEQKRTERIMLNLRTNKGIDLKKFSQEFGENLLETRQKQIEKLKDLGMIEIKNGHLKIAENKFSLSNAIIMEIL